uniref:Aspartyl beta-hydroxylase/Triadin domain-containing protein n=1 Tax=Paramormyrops kingsleyae TaxID=1676925 RepID=A0A3B3RSI0_9TELE
MGDLKEDLKMMADEGDMKQPLAGRNGKKSEHAQKSSFFTWFLVLAMLGAWTSVAVVWLDIVDYKDVLGHLAAYDVDGDGEFDVEDAKILLGLVSDDDRETMTVSESTDRLSEGGSGWFYEFLVFLYDIMTPFEIQETEEEEAEGAADEVPVAEEAASKKVKPKDNMLIRDVEWNLREALKRQMSILHERVEAKKIAKIALAEVRSLVAEEEKAKRTQALKEKSKAEPVKPKKKKEEKPRKKEDKAEKAKSKTAKKTGTERREKPEKEKRVPRKKESEHDKKTEKAGRGLRDKGEKLVKTSPKPAPKKSPKESSKQSA